MPQLEILHCIVGETPRIKKINDDLKTLQDAVGGYIELIRMRQGFVCICDEEGILKERSSGFAVNTTMGLIPIYGDFFICRVEGSRLVSLRGERDFLTVVSEVLKR
jgi:hypothetical protein